jgi:hypothetical protein
MAMSLVAKVVADLLHLHRRRAIGDQLLEIARLEAIDILVVVAVLKPTGRAPGRQRQGDEGTGQGMHDAALACLSHRTGLHLRMSRRRRARQGPGGANRAQGAR